MKGLLFLKGSARSIEAFRHLAWNVCLQTIFLILCFSSVIDLPAQNMKNFQQTASRWTPNDFDQALSDFAFDGPRQNEGILLSRSQEEFQSDINASLVRLLLKHKDTHALVVSSGHFWPHKVAGITRSSESRGPGSVEGGSPLERLVVIFANDPPAELVTALVPFSGTKDSKTAEAVFLTLLRGGRLGKDDEIAAMLKEAESLDIEYRDFYQALEQAFANDRFSKETRARILGTFWHLCINGPLGSEGFSFLLEQSPDKTRELLLADYQKNGLTKTNAQALAPLESVGINLPRKLILDLLPAPPAEDWDWEKRNDFSNEHALEPLLSMLGTYRNEEDLPVFRRWMEFDNFGYAKNIAVSGIYAFLGNPAMREDLIEAYYDPDFKLAETLSRYIVAETALYHIGEDGLWIHCLNYGIEFPQLAEAYEKMGAPKLASAIRGIIGELGGENYPKIQEELCVLLEKKEEKNPDFMDPYRDAYDEGEQPVEQFVFRYLLDHWKEFQDFKYEKAKETDSAE